MEVRLNQVAKTTVTVNSSSWKVYTVQVMVSAGSQRVAIAFTNDGLTATEDRNLYVDKVTISDIAAADTTAPTINLTAPAGGTMVSGVVTVSATASDNVKVAGVQFKLDGAKLGAEDTTSPYAVSWKTTTAAYGTRTLSAVARDAAGNLATATPITVTVDNPPKGSVVINGGAAATNSTAVTLTLSATDDAGAVSAMQCSNNGKTYTAPEPYATTRPWTLVPGDGGKRVYTKFRDAGGQWSAAATDTITLDTKPPTITFTSPTDGQILVAP